MQPYKVTRHLTALTPPLVFVLSEIDVQIVMFPFKGINEDTGLINAILFQKIPLWTSRAGLAPAPTDINMSVLAILFILLTITVKQRWGTRSLPLTTNSHSKIDTYIILLTESCE